MLPPSCLFQPEGLGAMAGKVFKMLMMICRIRIRGLNFPLFVCSTTVAVSNSTEVSDRNFWSVRIY